MNKEDLLKLKEKINNLSEEDSKKREEYLRNISEGTILGPQTGYSEIDKPYLSKYEKEPLLDLSNLDNIYDMIFSGKNMDDTALIYLEGQCTWTYGKLKKMTDKFIKGFKKQGIKPGDNVLYGALATPEFVAAYIALISIGAVMKGFDIRASEKDIVEYINSSNCKYAISFDREVLSKMAQAVEETNIEKAFVLRPGNSLSIIEKIGYLNNLKKSGKSLDKKIELPKSKKFQELSQVAKKTLGETIERVETDYSRPSAKVQSSGTTGKAKTIVHSEKSMVEFAKQTVYSDASIKPGKRVFVALPPWIAYGIGDAIINPLIVGCKVELSTDFNPDAVYRNIGRFDAAYAAPFHYRYIRDHYDELTEQQKLDLSKVNSLVSGGDKYSAKENKDDEELFKTTIVNGYGDNENWGCITVNPDTANKHGSVGIPKYGDDIVIYDSEKQMDLPYGEVGEICVHSKTMFMGYEGNEEATNKVIKQHPDGKYYLHTGDLGYIDNEGYLFVEGRKERIIVRQAFKLSAYTIEDAITNLDFVKECIAIEVPDEEEEHVPMVYAVKSENCQLTDDEFINQIIENCKITLKENEIPKYIQVVNKLDYTDNNKYDFRKYEQMGKEYVESLEKVKKI